MRTAVHVRRPAIAMAEAGYEVTVVDVEHDQSLPSEELSNGVHLRHVFVSPRSASHYHPISYIPWLLFKLTRIVRTAVTVIATPADVYHAHDITALPVCYLAATLRRKPLVFGAHELPLTQKHLVHRRLLVGSTRALLRLMMRRCAAVITVSPQLVDEMQRLYGGPRAVVVRNIPEYQSPGNDDRLRRHFDLPPTTRIALYQGGFQSNRSLDTLVRAAPYLATDNLIILMGAGECQEQLEGLIEELKVGERVKIKGAVPYAELLSWTTGADIGLSLFSPDESLSIRYCLPNKLFEYLMAGLPVLSTPLDAVVDLLREYDMGMVVNSLSPEVVGPAINAMLADDAGRARMRRNALKAARQTLNWEVERHSLLNLYADLLGTPQPAQESALAPTLPRMPSVNQTPQRQSSMK